jgi:predicted N-acyltransferase
MEMDISIPINDINKSFSKSIKEDIRKVKKNGYSYELTDDLDKFKLFYYKMYLPYTKRRYGNQAKIYNFISIRHFFETVSKLMLIKKDEEYVLGSLFLINKDKLITQIMGIMDDKINLLKNGLGCAAYYFTLLWAKENKIKKLSYGTCKPFLNDGLYQYKKKWGTIIKKADTKYFPNIFAFVMNKNSKEIQNLLLNNPFICLTNNQLKTMVFVKNKNKLKSGKITEISKKYKISGFDKFEILSSQD